MQTGCWLQRGHLAKNVIFPRKKGFEGKFWSPHRVVSSPLWQIHKVQLAEINWKNSNPILGMCVPWTSWLFCSERVAPRVVGMVGTAWWSEWTISEVFSSLSDVIPWFCINSKNAFQPPRCQFCCFEYKLCVSLTVVSGICVLVPTRWPRDVWGYPSRGHTGIPKREYPNFMCVIGVCASKRCFQAITACLYVSAL